MHHYRLQSSLPHCIGKRWIYPRSIKKTLLVNPDVDFDWNLIESVCKKFKLPFNPEETRARFGDKPNLSIFLNKSCGFSWALFILPDYIEGWDNRVIQSPK